MERMDLLPAIDLRQGRVVRLTRGDDAQRKVYGARPADVLADHFRSGASMVHVVDLDAAFGEAPQRDLVEALAAGAAAAGGPAIELGGGLRTEEAVAWALEEAGCARAVIGSMVARDFEMFTRLVHRFPDRLVPALDIEGDEVRVAGWTSAAGRSLDALCQDLRGLPCPAVLVTDVSRDGTLEGPNFGLARQVAEASGFPALLSGGVRSLDDLMVARNLPGIGGAVVGKALYEGIFTVAQALAAIAEEGDMEGTR